MTKYLHGSSFQHIYGGRAYNEGWERIWGKTTQPPTPDPVVVEAHTSGDKAPTSSDKQEEGQDSDSKSCAKKIDPID